MVLRISADRSASCLLYTSYACATVISGCSVSKIAFITLYTLSLIHISRVGHRPIPIRMESEGIIKIISILNALIQAFGNPSICLAIDELDAGIFEYMLGELLDIFQNLSLIHI